MDCSRIKELLSEYADQALDLNTNEIVREHLSSCKACSEELAALRNCVKNISSLQQVKVPEDFLQKVHERIERRFEFEKIIRRLFVPLKVKIPLEFAGVLAVVVLVIAVNRVNQPLSLTQPVLFMVEPNKLFEGPVYDKVGLSPAMTLSSMPLVAGTSESLYSSQAMVRGGAESLGILYNARNSLQVNTYGTAISGVQVFGMPGHNEKEYDKEFLKIANMVESLEGAITFVQLERETNLLESVTVRMPTKNYALLLNRLKEIGIAGRPRLSVISRDEESTELSIELLPAKPAF